MATRPTNITHLQRRVAALEQKVAALESQLAQRGVLSPSPSTIASSDADERLWNDLLVEGIVRPPTPDELALAAEWQVLPEAEKEATRQTLRTLKLTLSD